MNPQDQIPLDYLDQIAPKAQKKPFFSPRPMLFLLLVVGALVVVTIAGLVSTAISNSRTEPWERLSLRLTATREISDDATGKLKSSRLRSYNSDLKIFLTNMERDLAEPLTLSNIDIEEVSATIVNDESSATALSRLEDARLNNVYDRSFASEMSYQLALLLSQIKSAYGISSRDSTKEFLESSYDNLLPIYESFANYSTSSDT